MRPPRGLHRRNLPRPALRLLCLLRHSLGRGRHRAGHPGLRRGRLRLRLQRRLLRLRGLRLRREEKSRGCKKEENHPLKPSAFRFKPKNSKKKRTAQGWLLIRIIKAPQFEVLLFILLSYYQKNPTHLHHYPQRKQQNCYDWLNWKCKFFNICKFGIAFLIYNIN